MLVRSSEANSDRRSARTTRAGPLAGSDARARLWLRRARTAIARPSVPAFSAAEPASQSPSATAWQAVRMMLNSDRRIQHFIERASARSEMLTVIYPYVL